MDNRIVFRRKLAGRDGDIAAVAIADRAVIGDGGMGIESRDQKIDLSPFLVPRSGSLQKLPKNKSVPFFLQSVERLAAPYLGQ